MRKLDPITAIFLCITMLLYVGNSLTQSCVETLLTFFDWALQWVRATSRIQQQSSSSRFPRTVERLVELFNIRSKETVFACCPECFQLYTLPDYQPLQEPILELPHKGLPERRRTANDKGKGKERGGKGKGKGKGKRRERRTGRGRGKGIFAERFTVRFRRAALSLSHSRIEYDRRKSLQKLHADDYTQTGTYDTICKVPRKYFCRASISFMFKRGRKMYILT